MNFRFTSRTVAISLACIALVLVSAGFASKDAQKKILERLQGKVVSIADGDTITLLDDQREQHKIRLDGIDAPEDGQDYSKKSKQALLDLIFQKIVRVDVVDVDRYDRKIGRIWLDRQSVNKQMIADGWAWHYKEYSDSNALAQAEVNARKQELGLWAGTNPIPPWQWRDTLRREQEARRQAELAKQKAAADEKARLAANADEPDTPAEPAAKPAMSYWLTTSSSKRHNSSCRWYGNSKGRSCGPNDGVACKTCGG